MLLIPAHNEEEHIEAAIESVLAQTLAPHRIVVIADNCSDATVELARRYPVTVMETVGNTDRKAGALNQGWLRYATDARFVVTMDADTVLERDCLARLSEEMRRRKHTGGVCARPVTKPPVGPRSPWRSFIWHLVSLDFAMCDRSVVRRGYTVEVLGGFASMLRNRALHDVAARHGAPWSPDSIVEDYRLSLHLREAGWSIRMARRGRAYTDSPDTVRGLWRQRVRWCGGTFEELVRAGWRPWTRRNWLTYAGVIAGMVLRLLGVAAWTAILALRLPVSMHPIWFAPAAVMVLDRLAVVSRMPRSGWLHRLLVVTVLPMELLSLLGQAWAFRSMWLVLRRRRLAWN